MAKRLLIWIFYMGKKGDNTESIGWPNVISTKYLVDPTAEYNTKDALCISRFC